MVKNDDLNSGSRMVKNGYSLLFDALNGLARTVANHEPIEPAGEPWPCNNACVRTWHSPGGLPWAQVKVSDLPMYQHQPPNHQLLGGCKASKQRELVLQSQLLVMVWNGMKWGSNFTVKRLISNPAAADPGSFNVYLGYVWCILLWFLYTWQKIYQEC